MIRKTFLPALFALVACDVTQELQGPSQGADGGTSGSPADGGTVNNGDGGVTPTTDSGLPDGASNRQLSVCTPQSAIGTTAVAITGGESVYMHHVTDLAVGAGRVFALSEPWTFIGVPTGGGPAVGYDVTATLPNFVALGIAPTNTSPSGTLSTPALASYNLPTGGGQILALRGGGTSTASDVPGRIIVDQDDVFYFKKQSPSQLVHAATKSNLSEQLLVEYPSASDTMVTAAAVIGNYVYFTSAVRDGMGVKDAMFHRVPRNGGTVEDLVSLSSIYGLTGDIYLDGNNLYLTPGPEGGSVSTFIGIYSLQNGTLSSGSLAGLQGAAAYSRRSGVAFDGNAFYYGADTSSGSGCQGKLVRVSKAVVVSHAGGSAEALASNLDHPIRVLAAGGSIYVGTQGDPFYKPVGYPGQMLRWTP